MFVLTLSGCKPSASNDTGFTVMPQGFEGCKVGSAYNGGTFIMVRCPNSTTTTSYTSGKTKKYIVVDDYGIKSE